MSDRATTTGTATVGAVDKGGPSLGVQVVRFLRFSAVSVGAVVLTQALLQGFYHLTPLGGVGSNIAAVGLSAIPAFLVLRRWVWGRVGNHSVTREIVPFWAYTFAGLALSTAAVGYADHRWKSALAVSAANIAAFGVLWILKFFMLERWMFADRDPADGTRSTPE